MTDLVPKDTFRVDPLHEGVAFYSSANIVHKYKGLAEKLQSSDIESRAEGMEMLPQLIKSHLHMTWQNTFSSGIAVLKPLQEHTTSLVFTGTELARNLSQCTESPFPASCPPNKDRCRPCVSSHPMLLTVPPVFRNTSTLFTIGIVPHPYTLASLAHQTDALTVRFVRRETKRDEWIMAASKELLGTGLSSYARLVHMKDAIASDYGSSHSFWLTGERTDDPSWREDLAWVFGFPIPSEPASDGHSETPVPGPERRPPPPKPEGNVPAPVALEKERILIEKSRTQLKEGGTSKTNQAKEVIESWNLADTELWRFVRAFAARRRVERKKWEEDERAFAGSESKGTFGRWFDRRDVDEDVLEG